MGAKLDRLRYEVFQNLFHSPMNTGFLRPAVATVLTVYGIETITMMKVMTNRPSFVATVLTVYGIETNSLKERDNTSYSLQQCLPFTVLKPNVNFS